MHVSRWLPLQGVEDVGHTSERRALGDYRGCANRSAHAATRRYEVVAVEPETYSVESPFSTVRRRGLVKFDRNDD